MMHPDHTHRISLLLHTLSVATLCALLGCSDADTSAATPGAGGGGRQDAGGMDPDAGEPEPDAGKLNTGRGNLIIGNDGKELCGYDDVDVLQFEGSSRTTTASVTDVGGELALAFQNATDDLMLLAVPPSGPIGAPVRVMPGDEGLRTPQLVATDDALLLMWQSQAGGARGMQLWARSLGNAASDILPVAVLGDDGDRMPGIAGHASDFVAAYVPLDAVTPKVVRVTVDGALDGDAAALEDEPAGSDQRVQLARLDGGHTLAAWLAPDGDTFKVVGVVLDETLQPVGEPKELSKGPVEDAHFTIAGRRGSAGLVYQSLEIARPAVKFRRVENDGTVDGPLLNIVAAPGRVVDPSIAPFGQGYAVSYRALTSPGIDKPEVHLAFIAETGHVVYDAVLGTTTANGGATTVATTEDGHVLVSWKSVSGSGAATQGAHRLYCPGALVLCGGYPE